MEQEINTSVVTEQTTPQQDTVEVTQEQQKPEEPKYENCSYSKLGVYEQCPFKFKLRYIDKHYVNSDSIATEFGTAAHHAEESIANCIKDSKQINYPAIKAQYLIDMTKLQGKYYTTWYDLDKTNRTYEEKKWSYLDLMIRKLEYLLSIRPSLKVIGAEVPVRYVHNNKYLFKGSIDRLLYDDVLKKYIIMDIKSWPTIKGKEDELVTSLQFAVYTRAFAAANKISESDVICYYDLPFDVNTEINPEFGLPGIYQSGTKGFMKRAFAKIDKILTAIENKEFAPKTGKLCHWCEFCPTNPNQPEEGKRLCPYYCIWTHQNPVFEVANMFTKLEDYEEINAQYYGIQGGER